MKQNVFEAITNLIETAWRRRMLLLVPILVMVPLSVVGSRFLPQTYVTKALLAMQETGSDNPLIKTQGTNERIRDRAPGLLALVKSDRVLVNALHDILGERMPTDPKRIAQAVKDLDGQLTFEMVGTDFLEFQLKGTDPQGLGRKLEAITSRFLESLVAPDQDAQSATQVLLERRREDLAAAEKALARFKEQLGDRAVAAIAANDARLKEAQAAVQALGSDLAAVDTEIAALKGGLGSFAAADNSGRRDGEIRQALQIAEIAEKARSATAQADAQAARTRATHLTQLQALETRGSALRRDIEQATLALADQSRASTDTRSPEGQLRRLEREAAEARALFDSYRKRFPAATTSRALQVLQAPERIRVIDAPHDPQFPTTSRVKFIIMGVIASLLLSAGLVGCAELLDQRLRRAADFEAVAGVPVIGRLPPARHDQEAEEPTTTEPPPVTDVEPYGGAPSTGATVTPITNGRRPAA